MNSDRSMELLAKWKHGDEAAAEVIFDRYVDRLIALAGSRMNKKLQRRVAPDDVVQSVMNSFFNRVRDGRFELEESGDLWRLLAAITIKKVLGKVEFHQAQKRTIDAEASMTANLNSIGLTPEAIAREPSGSEVIAVTEELSRVIDCLQPIHRQMLELRLTGHDTSEIAEQTGRSERTVRRVLEGVRNDLAERL
ncbi:MAG: hypothetical protein KDA93_24330 [Planctomycetaceae bacterium]|nr:hypothetical protein [Planctomycetaceae bacterium]